MNKLEEVARVLCKARFLDGGVEDDDGWSDCPDGLKVEYLAMARAAVEALREPSEAMKRASADMYPGSDHIIGQEWRAMIDAILNEKPI